MIGALDDGYYCGFDALEYVAVFTRGRVSLCDDVQQNLAVGQCSVDVEELRRGEPRAVCESQSCLFVPVSDTVEIVTV